MALKNSVVFPTENDFEEEDFHSLTERESLIQSVRLENCRTADCDFSESSFFRFRSTDSTFNRVNFSGCLFEEPQWDNSDFLDCKFTGVRLFKSTIVDVVFRQCAFQLTQFKGVKFKNIKFLDCDFHGSDFDVVDFGGCIFTDCSLNGSTFSQCNLSGTDIRNNTIVDIRIDIKQLHNLIITSEQALYLAPLLGVQIIDQL